jgi:hypothetical protein
MGYWYLGSPYSKYPAGIDAAFNQVCIEAGRLIAARVPVFSPIAHTHPIAIAAGLDPYDHAIWLPADQLFMKAARGLIVLRLASWEVSIGLQYEIDYFRNAGKPVVFMDPGVIPEELIVPEQLIGGGDG